MARKRKRYKWRDNVCFSIRFLRKQKTTYDGLTCCFCGKEDLQIDTPYRRIPTTDMATVDHFYPKSLGIGPYEEDNLVVSCFKCNNDKGSEIYSIDTLKYIPADKLTRLIKWSGINLGLIEQNKKDG